MTNIVLRLIATFSLAMFLSGLASAGIRDDYELTVASVVKAMQGWQLYEDEKFAGSFKDGHYMDPDPNTRVKDFWSNGSFAKLDRDNNGHFETVFIVVEKQLIYAGSLGRDGNFIHVARDYKKYLRQPAPSFIHDIQRQHAR